MKIEKISRRALLGGSLMALIPFRLFAAGLKSDETVLFQPGYAMALNGEEVGIRISAWVFEFERRPGARTVFLNLLGVDFKKAAPNSREIFAQRSRYFLTDSERGKVLEVVTQTGETLTLPATNRAGRVDHMAQIRLATNRKDPPKSIGFSVKAPGKADEGFSGIAHFIPETGLSVVSDIDDTIKISNVANTRTLMRDSLIKPFAAVPGMARRYQDLALEKGTSFHYLSSSPIQLLPALQQFIDEAGFPAGSMHLRESTSWSNLIPGKGASVRHKTAMLDQLLADFPKRQFLLIGDSGEQDPEIYGEAARRFSTRDIRILIRRAPGAPATEARFAAAFAGLNPDHWALIDTDAP
ncbi:App1 family protein [Xinfangfangia sp. D13-10-4-6]|uniref:phosphatidate phosphatase App1 family protein n=1 Tax=Pseudogemmobacter hezensis TaxID=2737662 RepID=UPI001557F5AD|nr:phosphatase domain-containing protein [Pseudogemmobacter hezensis]NPD17011.1 App1 family protein [Pseudogemmobacter hezensis]